MRGQRTNNGCGIESSICPHTKRPCFSSLYTSQGACVCAMLGVIVQSLTRPEWEANQCLSWGMSRRARELGVCSPNKLTCQRRTFRPLIPLCQASLLSPGSKGLAFTSKCLGQAMRCGELASFSLITASLWYRLPIAPQGMYLQTPCFLLRVPCRSS